MAGVEERDQAAILESLGFEEDKLTNTNQFEILGCLNLILSSHLNSKRGEII